MNEYDRYIEQYKILHSKGKYGKSSEKLVDEIKPLVEEINPRSILDYGCGQSNLVNWLGIPIIYKYDPAIKKYNKLPSSATVIDLVLCNDVLEHIPEEYLGETLLKIKGLSDNVIFSVGTIKATHHLPNGENCHCTIKPIDWWMEKLKIFFPFCTFVKNVRDVKFLCKTWK